MPRKRCGCCICKYTTDPVDVRVVRKHVQRYGNYSKSTQDNDQSTVSESEIHYPTTSSLHYERDWNEEKTTEIFSHEGACGSSSSDDADSNEESCDHHADLEFENTNCKLKADCGSEASDQEDDDDSSLSTVNSE